jgi:succinate dehydrogenase / fumarate reductase cytochrome b subunit
MAVTTEDRDKKAARAGAGAAQRSPRLPARGRPNRLGVKGWVGGGRWGPERYLYTLHRVTGLGILVYFLAHIFVTASRVAGKASWDKAMSAVGGPVFGIGEYLVFAAFAIHALNGIRLIAVELGFAVGRPIEPVYPYKTSLGVQRPLAVILMVLAVAGMALGGWSFLHKPPVAP